MYYSDAPRLLRPSAAEATPTHRSLFACLLLIVLAGSLPVFGSGPDSKRLVREAQRLNRDGLFDQAEVILRGVLETDPSQSAAKVELAFSLNKQRRVREAYDIVFPVVAAEPRNSRAFAVLGGVLLTAGRFREARIALRNSVVLNRREDLAWATAGLLDYYENRVEDSLANLREAIYYKPFEPDYLFAFAQVSARAEKFRDAADAYSRFLNVSSKSDTDRRERIKSLIGFLRFLGDRDNLYEIGGSTSTSVKFDLVGDRPIIQVKLNERREPYRFVLDTGSGISVISKTTAEDLKIREITRGGFAKGIGGDGRFEIVYGFLRQIEIGDVAVRNVPIYIRDFHSDAQRVDGYIGLAVISKFLATIDYGELSFSLTREANDRKAMDEASASFGLPLRLTSSGFLSGEVKLDGIENELNFIVDTGASISVISDRVANIDSIKQYENEYRHRVIGSAGVTENVPSYLLPKVTFGPYSRSQINAIALNLDVINEASGFEQAGILGGNFLKNYKLTFDFRNSRVTFASVVPEAEQPK